MRRAPHSFSIAAALLVASGLVSCTLQDSSNRADSSAVVSGASGSRARGWSPDSWRPPVVDSTPDDPLEVSIYRGLSIITHVRDSLPAYTGSNLNCTSCHLDEGRRGNAIPLVGVFARYPAFNQRMNAVVPIEDRINYCFTRSLSGSKLPPDSREMQDIVAYLSYISRGVPNGEHVKLEGIATIPPAALPADSARGRAVFVNNCARCHGNDGTGMGPFPALWGPRSFSVGASMARLERAASFVQRNMPWDQPGRLSNQEAWDVAAYVTSQPRPDLPGKETDWPTGGAPPDVPYDTKGHKAFHPPKLFPRANPAAAIVSAPASVRR